MTTPHLRSAIGGLLASCLLAAGLPATALGVPVAMSFHSQSFRPAAVSFGADPDHTSGDIFLTPRNGYQRRVNFWRGPEIVDSVGQLVWFHPLPPGELANNLEVQQYQGKPVLTWWQGTESGGAAEDVIMDSNYNTVAIVRAGAGYQADTHEFQITPQNTALISAVVPVRQNLSGLGGPAHGIVDDCVIQEIDIQTGHVLWSWHALGHVPLQASYTRPAGSQPWDSRFKVGPLAKFEWQHDARLNGNSLSLFDDASDGPEQQESQSSAKVLILNLHSMTAVLAHRYVHSPAVVSVSQGNAQALPNHNVFVGWGSAPDFSEYTVNGRQIFTGTFALGVESYRAFRFPWTGTPTTPPDMANVPGPSGSVDIYASWNGATTVAAWRVLGGPTPQSLITLSPSTPRHGFETEIEVHSRPPYFEVQALDAHGHILGTSNPHPDNA